MGRAWRLGRAAGPSTDLDLLVVDIEAPGTWLWWPHGAANAHTHLGMESIDLGPHGSLPHAVRPLRRGRPRLAPWLDAVIPLESYAASDVLDAAEPALRALAAGGVRLVQDLYPTSEALVERANALGITLLPSVAWSPRHVRLTAADHLTRVAEVARWAGRRAAPWFGVATHVLDLLPSEDVDLIVAARTAAREHVPTSGLLAHWAEQPSGTRRPHDVSAIVAAADASGLLDEHTVLVHAVHATPAEQDLLAARQVAIVLCPGSNAWLRSGRAPAAAWLQRTQVALGTDSSSSNTGLDLWVEWARLVALLRQEGASAGAAVRGALAATVPLRGWTATPETAGTSSAEAATATTGTGLWWRIDDLDRREMAPDLARLAEEGAAVRRRQGWPALRRPRG